MNGIVLGFHVHEPKYDVIELLTKKDVNKMLAGKRYAFRRSVHSCAEDGLAKGKFVVDYGNCRIVRLITWSKMVLDTRLTCEMSIEGTSGRMFRCPEFTKFEMMYMNSVKKFDLTSVQTQLTYEKSKELMKRCARIVHEFGWTPTIRLRVFLRDISNRYIFDDYYKKFLDPVLRTEKTYLFLILPSTIPRDIFEHILKFLDPSTYETIPRDTLPT